MSRKPWISGLLYPQMKVERAGAHLKELQSQLAKFRADPYTVTTDDDTERALHIVYVRLKAMDRSVPMLVGDYAYALRSALDNLAWQLSLSSGRTPRRS